MKIVQVLLVSAIAVFTADSRDFPDNPDGSGTGPVGGFSSTNQDPIFRDGPVDHTQSREQQIFNGKSSVYRFTEVTQNIPDEPEIQDSAFEDQQPNDGTNGKSQIERGIQGYMKKIMKNLGLELKSLKSMIANSISNFESQLNNLTKVNAGIKGQMQIITDMQVNASSSQSKVNTDLKGKMQILTDMQANASSSQSKVNTDLKGKMQIITDMQVNASLSQSKVNADLSSGLNKVNTGLSSSLNKVKADLSSSLSQVNTGLSSSINRVNADLNKKIDSIEGEDPKQGCLKGTFWYPPSDQCFLYTGSARASWAGANNYCRARGLVIAKPYDPVGLRAYLSTRYVYSTWTWLGAQGAGSYTRWSRDGVAIRTSSQLWYNGHNGAKPSSDCLSMITDANYMKSYYYNPYFMVSCSRSLDILCEYIRK